MRCALLVSSVLLFACNTADDPTARAAEAAGRSGDTVMPEEGAPAGDQVVAEWEGGQITYGEVFARVETDLRSMEIEHRLRKHETLSGTLEGVVIEQILEAEATERGFENIEELLIVEVEEKVAAPDDAEVAEFYRLVSRELGGASLEESRPLLEKELVGQAQSERYREYVGALKAKRGVVWALPYPDLPRVDLVVDDNDPSLGAPDAPVTIVQFAEYQCPYCNRVNPTIDRLLEDYAGRLRMVYKDFPLSGHGRAVPAAVAAHCAGEQDKYWEMNRTLLANQAALNDSDLLRYAGELELDLDVFQTCLSSGRWEPAIYDDVEQGRTAGVRATPSFFINGIYLSGAQPYERFAGLIDRELAQ